MVQLARAAGRGLAPVSARLALVREWSSEVLGAPSSLEVTVASEDASFRRYLRVRDGKNVYIVMDAPCQAPSRSPGSRFGLALRALVCRYRPSMPRTSRGACFSFSDLGSRHYLDELTPARADALYADATSALSIMQSRIRCNGLPVYDAAFLRRELDLFDEWFLRRHLEVALSPGRRGALEACFEVIVAACQEQEQVFVHRDYHSRNLMVLPRGNPGILDFQGAVRGPIGYDIASLFRDVYISWPETRVTTWVERAYESLRGAGLLHGVDARRFRRWVDFCGVQRHLKIAGIFSRLFHRDGKPRYLRDLPLTLRYLRDVSGRYRSLEDIAALIDELDLLARVDPGNASRPVSPRRQAGAR